MKKLIKISLIIIILMFMLITNVYAFENEIYKIDIPNEYVSMSYSGIDAFSKSSDMGIMIYSYKSEGFKKNISTMTQSEIDEIFSNVIGKNATVLEQTKEKLGKSKAIKARVIYDGSYMDMYIVVSDKHILLISFVAPNEEELDSNEILNIKKSFKMKEKTTNTTLLSRCRGSSKI